MRVESTPDSARVRQIGYIPRAPLRLYILAGQANAFSVRADLFI